MRNIENFIVSVINEATLDSRISDGVIDMNNPEHIVVLAETMYDQCGDSDVVEEFIHTFMGEGKYPDRQAYNKDGWLVTFPSKEYRDAALKKKTHFSSDPTHGKGGMNLYYKKKGKQKRQTQQVATTTARSDDATPTAAAVPAPVTAKKPTEPQQTTSTETPSSSGGGKIYSDVVDDEVDDGPKEKPSSQVTKSEEPSTEPTAEPETAKKDIATPSPAVMPMPATESEPDYEELSKKFVAVKHWTLTPFGEYRDTQGNTMAVVGLSGEIVPIKSNDREEYKIFAEKNAVTQ